MTAEIGHDETRDEFPGCCYVCGGQNLKALPFRYAFKGRFLDGLRCQRCHMSFIHPQPTTREINELYQEDYFTESSDTVGAHGPKAYMDLIAESDENRHEGARSLDETILRYRGARGKLLEIGCGPGFLLAELEKIGWDVEGLELSEFAANHARERLGLDVKVGAIEPETHAEGAFDAVFMGDVLEHLPDPIRSLRSIGRWLVPDGVLLVAVPSTMNLLSARLGMTVYRVAGKTKTLRIPPYHLFEYTPRALTTTLETAGYELRDLRQSAVPIGSMGLRGSALENAGKVLLQIPALLTSRLFNRGGDRLLAVASPASSH